MPACVCIHKLACAGVHMCLVERQAPLPAELSCWPGDYYVFIYTNEPLQK